jgi:TRAP-type C4-dicarboxylate transport system permease small subunit
MQQWIERLSGGLERFFGALACLALVAIMLVVVLQIVARHALPQVPAWTEELSRYLFIHAIVLASGSVIVRQRHVRLELFHERLSPRRATILTIAGHVLVAAFVILLLSHAWRFMLVGQRQTSPTLGISMSWVFASALVFLSLTGLFSILSAVQAWLAHCNRSPD